MAAAAAATAAACCLYSSMRCDMAKPAGWTPALAAAAAAAAEGEAEVVGCRVGSSVNAC